MAKFNPPSYRIPLGFIEMRGPSGRMERIDVIPDKVFFDYLSNVFERLGGESGLSSDELAELISAAQAGEMAIQQPATPTQLPDVVQPQVLFQIPPDVMQPGAADQFTEMTFQ